MYATWLRLIVKIAFVLYAAEFFVQHENVLQEIKHNSAVYSAMDFIQGDPTEDTCTHVEI